MSCTMKCGAANIWPLPTGKSQIGSHSNKISPTMIKLDLRTQFKNVEAIYKEAFVIFQRELIALEKNGMKGVEEERKADVDANKNDVIETVGVTGDDKKVNKKYAESLSNVELEVHILNSPDIHMTLDTDESYNLTITREFYNS